MAELPRTDSRQSLTSRDPELPPVASAPAAPATQRGRRIALAILLALSLLAVAWIVSPLWVGVVLGMVVAFTTQSTFVRLAARLGGRRSLAAALTTVVSGILLAFAGAFAIYVVTVELVDIVGVVRPHIEATTLPKMIGERGAMIVDHLGLDPQMVVQRLRTGLESAANSLAASAAVVLQTATGAVFMLFIALITEYYVLVEWPRIAPRLERVLPLDPRHTRALILEFRDVGRSAFVGTVATAIVQGVLAGIGFLVVGVPNAYAWALLTAIASFLPLVGTALVWFPISLWLIWQGHDAWRGIVCMAWGVLAVTSLADYVIRPRLVGNQGHGHPLLMLFALLGGIEVFGLAGLFLAPILMSLFLAVLRIYERELAQAQAQAAVTVPMPTPPPGRVEVRNAPRA